MEDKYYSIIQIMDLFGCCRATVNTWFKKGLVKTKLGKLTRVKESDLKSFIIKLEKESQKEVK